jgi:arsenate reductase
LKKGFFFENKLLLQEKRRQFKNSKTQKLSMTAKLRVAAITTNQYMKKIYHLSTCNTCQKIIAELDNGVGFELQNIKIENISAEALDALAAKVGSYEALFSRKAMKFRSMGLHERTLTEQDYRQLMLDEYTFLKRPFILIGEEVFIGNTKAVVAAAKSAI